MRKFVEKKKQELAQHGGDEEQHRGDVFTRLVAASEGDGKYGLDEPEVVMHFWSLLYLYLIHHTDRQYFHAHVCGAWCALLTMC